MKNLPAITRTCQGAFTLIEILLAAVAAAMILVIINGIFVRAIHVRDDATERVHMTRLRARAEHAIRDDLQSALVSGGILACTLNGGTNSTSGPGGSSFPGYLKMTTTNGRSASGTVGSDVQQVEYYLTRDPSAGGEASRGALVRAVTRDLLASTLTVSKEETILTGVQSLQVQFYDGANWVDTWEFDSDTANASASTGGATITTGNATLPEAIRVDVRQVAKAGNLPLPPVEVLVPWTTQPFVGATPAPVSTTGTSTGTGQNNPQGQGNGNGQNGNGPGGQGPGGPGGQEPGGGPPGGQPPGQQPPTTNPGRPPSR